MENLVKVHITLTSAAKSDPVIKQKVWDSITVNMKELNEKRFKRFGIISGLLPEFEISNVTKLKEIAGVELDSKKSISESEKFINDLKSQGKAVPENQKLPSGATHIVKPDGSVKRKRFNIS